jgi:ATP-dependent protease ClpP protease subunit
MIPQFRVSGFIGETPATADDLAAFLASAAGQPVEIVVNSPGGSAYEGAAMLAEMQRYPGRVAVLIEGIAASAASLVAMGGDEILIDAAAVLMIHNPASLTIGTAADHRASADTLDKLGGIYADAYAARSGNRVADVLEWMAAETWMTAEEAVALGFADRVTGKPETSQPRARMVQARAQWAATMRQNAERNSHVTA